MARDTWRSIVQKIADDQGLEVGDPDEFADMVKQRYQQLQKDTKDELEKPRTSTVEQTLQQAEGLQNIEHRGELQGLDIYRRRGQINSDIADGKADREIRVQGGKLKNQADYVKGVLGVHQGTLADGRDHYGVMHDKEIAYREGRDKQYFDYLRNQRIENRDARNLNFVKDLALTAGLIFI